jgi:hypothetical protein|tara:strand:- start:273 stop:440 length:168 start_codon:yes stop_codon:yes gene_type:complete
MADRANAADSKERPFKGKERGFEQSYSEVIVFVSYGNYSAISTKSKMAISDLDFP